MKYLIFAFLGLVLVSSCKKEDEVTRNDFVGTWNAEESIIIAGQTMTDDYTFVITPDPGNSDKLIMTGFANIGAPLSATVSGRNFTTEEIGITYNGINGTFNGSGSLNGNTLTYEYTIVTDAETFEWNGTATKQ